MSKELLAVAEQIADHLSRVATSLEELHDRLLTRPAAAPAPSAGGSGGGGGRTPLPVAPCFKTEDGRFQYEMPKDAPPAKCKKCGETMYWIQTRQGKNKPMDADGFDHRDSCSENQEQETQKKENVPF